jgi:formamidopyrimidine-DNA glycosylase
LQSASRTDSSCGEPVRPAKICQLLLDSPQCNSAGRTILDGYILAMPELAEVEWYRKQWNAGLGKKIVDVRLHGGNRVFRGTDSRELHRRLVDEKFLSSEAHGKRMLFKFSSHNWLGIHLGMTGGIRVESGNFHPNKHDHLVLYQSERALVFTDSRQFGRVRFHHGRTGPDWCKRGVPEITSPEFDQQFVDQFLDRHSKAPIKSILLLQDGFSGIGNWMADEILWRAKFLPSKRTGRLTQQERAAIFRATKFVARRSLETLGRDFSDLPRNWLIHQKWKRDGICPLHRTHLRHAIIGGRTTAWCPRCQK